jgi:osmotically-inducible protein OsmY
MEHVACRSACARPIPWHAHCESTGSGASSTNHSKENDVRERHYEGPPSQAERERRFGERGNRGREQGERQRFGERSFRDEDEGFGEEYERQGFEGGQSGWRQEYNPYGQGGEYSQAGQRPGGFGQAGYGGAGQQGPGRRSQGREQDDFGRYDRRQEYGIDRNQGYGAEQGTGSQRYGSYESERTGSGQGQGYGSSAGFGAYGQGRPQQGRFTGRGPKGWQRSDQSILERVNETLEQHPEIDASEIEVQCEGGEIVLRGTVDERRAKRLAEDAIENLPGVKDVRNEIRVQEPQNRQAQQPGAGQQQPGAGRDNGGRTRSS